MKKNEDDRKIGIFFLEELRGHSANVRANQEEMKSQSIQSGFEKTMNEEIEKARLRVSAAEENLKHEKAVRIELKAVNEPKIKEIDKKIEALKDVDDDIVMLVNDKNIDSNGECVASVYFENPNKKEISALKEQKRVLVKQIKTISDSIDTAYELLAKAKLNVKELEADFETIQKQERSVVAENMDIAANVVMDVELNDQSFFEKISNFFGNLLQKLPFRR